MVRPAPERMAAIFPGQRVELHELSYGALREAMRQVGEAERYTEAVLAASLHVDDAPLGLEALYALPGRFAGAITEGLRAAAELHQDQLAGGEGPKA
jgi:hypothetical protein